MPFTHLLPIITVAATKGLGCGTACGGACGNPMTNVFLASYLLTHSGKLKRSLFSFISFYAGKIISVVLLCVIAALLGSRIIDETGRIFGLNMQFTVQLLMFLFALVLIGRWFYKARKFRPRCGGRRKRSLPMLVCGFISGVSPCAPLILAVGYAAGLTVADAVVIGVVFSVASSALPLLVLTVLTGLLSGAMLKEIPHKIRYLQLGAYVVVAVMSGYTMMQYVMR